MGTSKKLKFFSVPCFFQSFFRAKALKIAYLLLGVSLKTEFLEIPYRKLIKGRNK